MTGAWRRPRDLRLGRNTVGGELKGVIRSGLEVATIRGSVRWLPVLQGGDVVWPVFMSLGGLMLSAFTYPLVLVVAVPLAVLYVPTVVVARWLARARLQRDVDLRLSQVRTEDVVRPFPKRS